MQKVKITKFINEKFKVYLTATLLAVALVAGGTYAWNAVWHGTNWVEPGKVISAREIAENFEYLKQEVDGLREIINNLTLESGAGMYPTEVGIIDRNSEVNFGNNWVWIHLKGSYRYGDSWYEQNAVGGSIARLPDGQIKVVLSASVQGAPTGLKVFTPSSNYNCVGGNYKLCVKLVNNNLFIKQTSRSYASVGYLHYTKFASASP